MFFLSSLNQEYLRESKMQDPKKYKVIVLIDLEIILDEELM